MKLNQFDTSVFDKVPKVGLTGMMSIMHRNNIETKMYNVIVTEVVGIHRMIPSLNSYVLELHGDSFVSYLDRIIPFVDHVRLN